MRPSSKDIIESIIAAIDSTVLPAVEDKQAASSLRAGRTLLEHLAARIEVEPDLLAADNDDAERTFATLGIAVPRCDGGSLNALNRHNEVLQTKVDEILRSMPINGRENAAQAKLRTELRAYLKRRQIRERELIFPAFLGPPF